MPARQQQKGHQSRLTLTTSFRSHSLSRKFIHSFIHSLLSVIDKRKKWYLSRRFHLDNEAAAVDGDDGAAEEQPYSR